MGTRDEASKLHFLFVAKIGCLAALGNVGEEGECGVYELGDLSC